MMTERRYAFVTTASPDQARQIVALYRAEGWWYAGDGDDSRLILPLISGSHCFLLAFEGKDIVGMGRAISDRISDAYIQDVNVIPSRRGFGIGTTMIQMIVERLHADGLRWIGLIAERDSSAFYEKIGFKVMPASKPMLMRD